MDAMDIRILCFLAACVLMVFAISKVRWVTPQKDKQRVILLLFLAFALAYIALFW